MENYFLELIIGTVLTVLGYFLRATMQDLKDVKKDQHALEINVARNYVNKTEFGTFTDRIMDKLDHIDNKLDRKVDKNV